MTAGVAPRVLITVSGEIPAGLAGQVRRGERPRVDYLELQAALGADLLDVTAARQRAGRFGRLLERVVGRALLLAWACYRQRRSYDVILTDGEQVGIPLAVLCWSRRRRAFAHVMIGHILSVRKKVLPFRWLRLDRRVDTIVVYSSWQRRFAVEKLRMTQERVVLTPFMVDTKFFTPDGSDEPDRDTVCTAGLEFRDYPTLISAARCIDARVVIAAASTWSKRPDTTKGQSLPPNVEVCSLDLYRLRELYAASRLVVMPLYDVTFQAGVTTILEAMAMGKPVVCSRTRGQTDVVVDGVNGLYVAPGDVDALTTAIVELLHDRARRERLGRQARRYAVEQADIDVYVSRLAGVVRAAAERRASSA